MNYSVSPRPMDDTYEESAAGFKRTALSLGNFVGAYPGAYIEVVARRLSSSDALIKQRYVTRRGETRVCYRHLRYGYPSVREKIRILWRDLRFGFWRSWRLRGLGCGQDWQHVPKGGGGGPAGAGAPPV